MKKKFALIIYLIIQITLYITSIFLNIDIPTKYMYYTFIVINFAFSLWLLKKFRTIDAMIVSAALFFTMISDTFLVLIQNYKLIAMASFSIVQILYYIRLYSFRDVKNKVQLFDILRIVILMVVYTAALVIFKDKFDMLIILVVFYFSMLVINFIEGIKYFQKSKMFIIGLLLFICCDIMIGVSNGQGYLTINEESLIYKLMNCGIDLGWFFYFPSQILIVLSILEIKREKNVIFD